jgi:hypothetical protein
MEYHGILPRLLSHCCQEQTLGSDDYGLCGSQGAMAIYGVGNLPGGSVKIPIRRLFLLLGETVKASRAPLSYGYEPQIYRAPLDSPGDPLYDAVR